MHKNKNGKRIGIITFHRAENFGAAIQILALQKSIQDLGHKVEIIDYQNEYIEYRYKLFGFKTVIKHKSIIYILIYLFKKLTTLPTQLLKKRKYKKFRKYYLNINKNKFYADELDYDIMVCGSDQIWNPLLTNGFDPTYFLYFDTNKKIKRISYGASSEKHAYNYFSNESEKITKYLNNLDCISVREENLRDILQKYTSKHIKVVLDPTFLQNRNFYEYIAKKTEYKNYILVYHIADSKIARNLANQLAKSYKKKVIEIHSKNKFYFNYTRHKRGLGPEELLGLIKDADIVLTTSFHGAVLSLIFNKEFFVIDDGPNIRQKNILEKFQLSDRVVNNINGITQSTQIDYKKINDAIQLAVQDSLEFLNKSIENEE